MKDLVHVLEEHVTDKRRDVLREVLADRTRHITMILEDIYQPHNASAVLRTCDCFGVQDVHVIENKHEYSISSNVALGSSKWIDLHRYSKTEDNTLECINSLKQQGYRIVATSPHADEGSLEDLDITQPTAILLGTEGPGLTETALEAADVCIKIPMFGFTESFNLSVSAAIILHHLTWKLRAGDQNWRLSDQDSRALHLEWLKRSVRGSKGIIERFEKQ